LRLLAPRSGSALDLELEYIGTSPRHFTQVGQSPANGIATAAIDHGKIGCVAWVNCLDGKIAAFVADDFHSRSPLAWPLVMIHRLLPHPTVEEAGENGFGKGNDFKCHFSVPAAIIGELSMRLKF
jgi:hypothetical protein